MFNLNRNDEYNDMNIKKNFIISIEIHGIDFDIFAPVDMSYFFRLCAIFFDRHFNFFGSKLRIFHSVRTILKFIMNFQVDICFKKSY